jgi:phosphoserine phosphatase
MRQDERDERDALDEVVFNIAGADKKEVESFIREITKRAGRVYCGMRTDYETRMRLFFYPEQETEVEKLREVIRATPVLMPDDAEAARAACRVMPAFREYIHGLADWCDRRDAALGEELDK